MISLHGKVTHLSGVQIKGGPIALTKNPNLPKPLARKFALISDDLNISDDYQAVFRKKVVSNAAISEYMLPEELHLR
jgi:hypothetical protein